LKQVECLADLNSLELNAVAIAILWQWFSKHASALKNEIEGTTPFDAYFDIEDALKKIDPRLRFEIGSDTTEERKLALYVSANCVAEVVPLVLAIVDAAPVIDGWDVIALKPRKRRSLPFTFVDIYINPSDFLYTASCVGGQLDIVIYTYNINKITDVDFISGVYKLIEHEVGEMYFITRIKSISISPRYANTDGLPMGSLFDFIEQSSCAN
jgi:hypothetical protein